MVLAITLKDLEEEKNPLRGMNGTKREDEDGYDVGSFDKK